MMVLPISPSFVHQRVCASPVRPAPGLAELMTTQEKIPHFLGNRDLAVLSGSSGGAMLSVWEAADENSPDNPVWLL